MYTPTPSAPNPTRNAAGIGSKDLQRCQTNKDTILLATTNQWSNYDKGVSNFRPETKQKRKTRQSADQAAPLFPTRRLMACATSNKFVESWFRPISIKYSFEEVGQETKNVVAWWLATVH